MRPALLVILLWMPSLQAQPAGRQEAAQLFRDGQAHYTRGEYGVAIVDFNQAYELSHAPGLLFNIAQAYRHQGDCARSLDFYQRYLAASPQAPNRAQVEQYIAAMRNCTPTGTAKPLPPAAEPAPVAPPAGLIKPQARQSPSWGRIGAYSLTGMGLAGVLAGVVMSLTANADAQQVTSFMRTGGVWTGPITATASQGRLLGVLGPAALGLGAAASAAGIVLLAHRSAEVAYLPLGLGGGGLALRGRF